MYHISTDLKPKDSELTPPPRVKHQLNGKKVVSPSHLGIPDTYIYNHIYILYIYIIIYIQIHSHIHIIHIHVYTQTPRIITACPPKTNRIFGTPWKPLERPLRTTTTCASWEARNFPGQSWVVIFGDFHGSTQKCMVYNGKSYYNEWGYPHSRTISIYTHTYKGAIISMVNDVIYIYNI